ncbi:CCQ_1a_G0025330.mRNA.1.CDS.1 [Saccharomyces cerevisiae]|nr:CCQ_1a_G0025330.mRNA.1.CDS.1 [Saccharomyces cerevisiae]CAI7338664.1 CCQ_1a_G0025330.mRNA.1.CDS.1 [Saccharomyces cerevisiae]
MYPHHYARHLPQRSIPVPFTHKAHDYPHFNIYISFSGPKYCITALNAYVIPLLRHILTTQFIHTYVNITKKSRPKSRPKSPKHKKITIH